MPTKMHKIIQYGMCLVSCLLLAGVNSIYAAGPPVPSSMENPLVIGFVILMLILLLVIGMLANLLIGVAQVKRQKEKQESAKAKLIATTIVLLALLSNPLLAQDAGVAKVSEGISGLSAMAFYLMVSVIFLELIVIVGLLFSVKTLLKVDKEAVEKALATSVWKARFVRWWIRLNSFTSKEQEAGIDLGHDYDGIRELDNRLPPWWLYGFYLTIIVAGIYLYRFHISHTGPTGVEEYETAVAKADLEVKEYLKSKGDAVDENTVTLLTDPGDIAEGKTFFLKSCVACHNEGGAGNVGPNLTDDYWLHGGDIKSVFKAIRYGINAMPQWQNSYSNKQIAELASYVKSLKGSKPANPKAPQGVLENEGNLPGKATTDSSSKIAAVTATK